MAAAKHEAALNLQGLTFDKVDFSFGHADLTDTTGDPTEENTVASCWSLVDRIRAEERERLAKLFDDHYVWEMYRYETPPVNYDRHEESDEIARWLRAGGKEPGSERWTTDPSVGGNLDTADTGALNGSVKIATIDSI